MMKNNFEPDLHKRVRERAEKKDREQNQPNQNQPRLKIWAIPFFGFKPRDKVYWYFVDLEKPYDVEEVEDCFNEVFPVDVKIFTNVIQYVVEVQLDPFLFFEDIEALTLKALEALK